jgi:hypothetical protein
MAATATDTPVVICETQFAAAANNDANVVSGIGFGAALNTSSPLIYGGLLLNVQTGATANIGNLTATQRSIVITHEIGHVLGLGHSSYAPALMYFSVGTKSNLSLSKDDWDGMAYLYPRDEVGQTDLTAGCGQIKNSNTPSQNGKLIFLLMLLPLIWLSFLRRRVRVSSSISKY